MKAKEIVKDDLKTAINQLGGIKAVSDRFDIPYRTVQNWSDGTRTPPNYVYRMIVEVEKQDKRDNENYKDYVEEQEGLGWYQKELEKEQQRNEVLQKQFDAMAEIAKNRREEIEANEAAIDQLEKALNATREELAKERHAREVWASQAARFSNW